MSLFEYFTTLGGKKAPNPLREGCLRMDMGLMGLCIYDPLSHQQVATIKMSNEMADVRIDEKKAAIAQWLVLPGIVPDKNYKISRYVLPRGAPVRNLLLERVAVDHNILGHFEFERGISADNPSYIFNRFMDNGVNETGNAFNMATHYEGFVSLPSKNPKLTKAYAQALEKLAPPKGKVVVDFTSRNNLKVR